MTTRGRTTFVVGRLDRQTSEIRVLEERRPPIRGPFALRAVVRPTRPRLRVER